MASPTVSGGINQPDPSWQVQSQALWVRRCGAWIVELSLVAASALVPFSLGALVNRDTQPVPLNPVVGQVSDTVAQTFALRVRERNIQVAPLTNLLWSFSLIAPAATAGWQLYRLAKTGQTTPKRWLGIRVTTSTGAPPGWRRAITRETVGRWGPLALAYAVWRLSYSFPDLVILVGLSGIAVAADGLMARFHPKRQTGHDLIAGTFVREVKAGEPATNPFSDPDWTEEDAAIAALVLTPEASAEDKGGLWTWMRQHPGLTLLTVTLLGMASVLGTFIGTQVYIQGQTTLRASRQWKDEVFLALVGKLSTASPGERKAAILGLGGATEDPRTAPLLVDLLAQETNPALLDIIQQVLVNRRTQALPYLQRLNQALTNDLEAMRYGGNSQERQLAALRQRTTKRAISKILTVSSGQVQNVDLSRTDLSEVATGPAQFALVLNKADLSGIRLRSADLIKANLQGTRFYGAGEDRRLGTYDDWVADLSGANLEGANLTGAVLNSAVMTRTNFLRATLNKANLANGNLTGANLSSTLLIGADLRQASLQDASLTGADLGGANLSQANLENARLSQTKAQGVQLSRSNLKKTDWQGADLSGADLSGVNLQNADLNGTRLASAKLQNANLQNANLRNADLSLVDFRGAYLAGANFQGATFVGAKTSRTEPFIQSPSATAKSDRLKEVDFSEVKNLDASQVAYICLQGGLHPKCPQKN